MQTTYDELTRVASILTQQAAECRRAAEAKELPRDKGMMLMEAAAYEMATARLCDLALTETV